MNDLPPDIEKAVERHLASGRFASVEEVLRAAMKTLDASGLESLKQSIADEKAGRLQPLDEIANRIREESGLSESN